VVSNAAPPKKKGSLKAKLAEKEALRASKAEDDDSYDEDAVLDPRAKALRDKQRELESDMKNAAELFGTDSSGTPHFLVHPHHNGGCLIPLNLSSRTT
jgi:translation initiation factor 3 subunit J